MSTRKKTKQTEPQASTSERVRVKQQVIEELENLGKEIEARIAKLEKAQAAIAEKSGRDVKDWIDHRDSIGKLLADARQKCKVACVKFKEFQEKHAPGFGRTQLYELLRVGRGVLTIEDQRERERAKKQAQRAANKAAESSGTTAVPDAQASRVIGTNPMTDEEAKDRLARLDGEEPKAEESGADGACPPVRPAEREPEQHPEKPYTFTAEGISDDALAAFKKACWEFFGKMLEPDRGKARKWFNEDLTKQLTMQLAQERAQQRKLQHDDLVILRAIRSSQLIPSHN
jgi:hypothetical protein